MNCNDIEVNLGEYLKELKQNWRTLDATNNCIMNELYNDSTIREIHNSVARNDVIDKGASRFMSYVAVDGKVYELNTFKKTPVCLAAIPEGQDWVDVVQPFMKDRIVEYIREKTDYKLMAVVENHQLAFKRKTTEIAKTEDMNHKVQTELNRLLTLAHNDMVWNLRRTFYLNAANLIITELTILYRLEKTYITEWIRWKKKLIRYWIKLMDCWTKKYRRRRRYQPYGIDSRIQPFLTLYVMF